MGNDQVRRWTLDALAESLRTAPRSCVILCDLDGTLVAERAEHLDDRGVRFVESVRSHHSIVVLSNRRPFDEASRISRKVHLRALKARKPLVAFWYIRRWKRKRPLILIGDQLVIDFPTAWFGGIECRLVQPILPYTTTGSKVLFLLSRLIEEADRRV